MLTSITILLFIFFSFNLYTNYHSYKWYILSIIAVVLLAAPFLFSNATALFFFFVYCTSSALHVGLYGVNKHFAHPKQGLNPTLSMQSLKTALALMTLLIVYHVVSLLNLHDFFKAIHILLIINCVWTLLPKSIMEFFRFKTEKGATATIQGFGANVSANATLLSLMAPFALIDFQSNLYLNLGTILLTLIAIIKTTAASGLVAFITSMWFFFLIEYYQTDYVFYPLLVIGLLFGSYAAYLFFRDRNKPSKHLLSMSGRKEIWEFSNQIIKKNNGNKWLGIGVGAYSYIMPHAQQMEAKKYANEKLKEYIKNHDNNLTQEQINIEAQRLIREGSSTNGYLYQWAHCDLLQFIIEGGYIGLIIFLIAFTQLIYLGIMTGNWVFLTFAIAYMVNSLTNFPHHLANECFLIILMIQFVL